jgi:hypothetical protein
VARKKKPPLPLPLLRPLLLLPLLPLPLLTLLLPPPLPPLTLLLPPPLPLLTLLLPPPLPPSNSASAAKKPAFGPVFLLPLNFVFDLFVHFVGSS